VNEKVLQVADADFDSSVLQSDIPVLVDFWAPWCMPCRMIAPVLDELAEAYDGRVKIVKINVDENRATSVKYQVQSIPMLLLFVNGEIKASQLGVAGKAQLANMLDSALT